MNDPYTNYCLAREGETSIGLYAGKTEGSLWGWISGKPLTGQAPRSNGTFAGFRGSEFVELKAQTGSTNPKLREQVFINTVRAAEALFPNSVVALNKNNVGAYSHVTTVDQVLLRRIIEYIKGTRLMTEKAMLANKRKISRVLAKMKKGAKVRISMTSKVVDW